MPITLAAGSRWTTISGAVYLTNFLWAGHVEIRLFYRDRLLARLPEAAELIEVAPGHLG
jgi:hypothetical protein